MEPVLDTQRCMLYKHKDGFQSFINNFIHYTVKKEKNETNPHAESFRNSLTPPQMKKKCCCIMYLKLLKHKLMETTHVSNQRKRNSQMSQHVFQNL